MVVNDRIIDLDLETENLGRQAADCREQRIGRHHAVVLRRDQGDPCIHQILLCIEDVERGALTHASLLAHAVERNLGGGDLRLRGVDLRLGSLELAYESNYGTIRSAWSVTGTEAVWKVTIPPNAKGILPILSEQAGRWSLDGETIARSAKLKAIGKEAAKEVFEVPAGSYTFRVKQLQP